jgi:chromosome partitioning protein
MAKHVIAVLNQKGGVGKTTTAINLAAYLKKGGRKVLICDIDPQGNSTGGLGINKQTVSPTLYDVLFFRAHGLEAIQKSPQRGFDILPANSQLAAAEVELVGTAQREFQLKKVLEPLDYDIILIDCPPSLGLLSINALTAATDVLVPVQAEYYALEGLGQLLDVVSQVRAALNPSLNLLGIILTMYDSRNSLSDSVKAELINHFGNRVFETVIPRNVRLAEAPSFGRTIAEHDRWSKGARSYKALAKELERKLV